MAELDNGSTRAMAGIQQPTVTLLTGSVMLSVESMQCRCVESALVLSAANTDSSCVLSATSIAKADTGCVLSAADTASADTGCVLSAANTASADVECVFVCCRH